MQIKREREKIFERCANENGNQISIFNFNNPNPTQQVYLRKKSHKYTKKNHHQSTCDFPFFYVCVWHASKREVHCCS